MPLKCTGKQTKFAKTASGFLIGRAPNRIRRNRGYSCFSGLKSPLPPARDAIPAHFHTTLQPLSRSRWRPSLLSSSPPGTCSARSSPAAPFARFPRWFCNRFWGNTRGWGWFRRRPGPALIPRASGKNRREVDSRCAPARVTLDLPERTSSAARHDAPSRRTSR